VPVCATTPEPSAALLLQGLDFADAYQLVTDEPAVNAAAAAHRVFSRTPGWIAGLLALRNRIGALIGLKGTEESVFEAAQPPEKRRRIGFFPVVSEAADRIVMGFDDWHLDFRVVVDVLALGAGRQQVTTTTLVRTHNWIGRVYLAIIMPFHRVIVRTMLAQAAKA
jgi:Protein of unknown function (DUF2867)